MFSFIDYHIKSSLMLENPIPSIDIKSTSAAAESKRDIQMHFVV